DQKIPYRLPLKSDVTSDKFKKVWFSRGNDDYLLYLQVHYYVDSNTGCGDDVIEFKKTTGQWAVANADSNICVD
ncbi:MAG: hypothetical protein ACHQAZ_01485, partial [Gammaproteobacteria bacterium]